MVDILRFSVVLLALFLLNACSTLNKRSLGDDTQLVQGRFALNYALNNRRYSKQASFRLERGIEHMEGDGSGKGHGRHGDKQTLFTVSAALSMPIIQIQQSSAGVTLRLSDGKEFTAPTFLQLRDKLSARILLPPLPQFFDWLEGRGKSATGVLFSVNGDSAQYTTLSGWQLKYSNWLTAKPKITISYARFVEQQYVKMRVVIDNKVRQKPK